jgi:hypothetical protein
MSQTEIDRVFTVQRLNQAAEKLLSVKQAFLELGWNEAAASLSSEIASIQEAVAAVEKADNLVAVWAVMARHEKFLGRA